MDLNFLSGLFANPWNLVRSLVDIAIVAYLFYRILNWVHGTRAEQLLKGLGLLIVFSAVISYFNLAVIKWLMDKMWILFAVTLPIVFQPELRRLLEQLGRGTLFSGFRWDKDHLEPMLQEVAEAAAFLSQQRIGALIVFTKSTGINEYMESGTPLDALVSAPLLVNIFEPDTPLHDGAVVIAGERINRAACFFPLADNPNIAKELGTRHRAAIGITEISDALALVVSEETGSISLAKEGQIKRHLSDQTLLEILQQELLNPSKWNTVWIKRWLNKENYDETET